MYHLMSICINLICVHLSFKIIESLKIVCCISVLIHILCINFILIVEMYLLIISDLTQILVQTSLGTLRVKSPLSPLPLEHSYQQRTSHKVRIFIHNNISGYLVIGIIWRTMCAISTPWGVFLLHDPHKIKKQCYHNGFCYPTKCPFLSWVWNERSRIMSGFGKLLPSCTFWIYKTVIILLFLFTATYFMNNGHYACRCHLLDIHVNPANAQAFFPICCLFSFWNHINLYNNIAYTYSTVVLHM